MSDGAGNDPENSEAITKTQDVDKTGSTILVAGVLADFEEALEALVSNSRRGGGVVADYVYDNEHELAWITFEDPKVAENFLKLGFLTILGHKMEVLLPPDKKTLYVRNVSVELSELVEIFVESPKMGGGRISGFGFDVESGTATVSFDDEQVVQNLLDKKFIEIKGEKLYFSKIPSEALLSLCVKEGNTDEAKINDELSANSNVKTDETTTKTDDGTVEKDDGTIKTDDGTTKTVDGTTKTDDDTTKIDDTLKTDDDTDLVDDGVDLEDTNMADNKSKSSANGKSDEEDENIDVPESDLVSRTIYVKEVPSDMIDFLEIVLMQEKTGGGNIEELSQDGADIRVTFEDLAVAKKFLNSGKVMFGTKEFTVVAPPVEFSRTFSETFEEDKENEEDKPPSATVLVRGIPPNIDKDILLMMLEREEVGGGPVDDVEFVPGSGEAIIQFEDYNIAQDLLSAGRFQYKNTQLEILPITEKKDEFDEASVEIRNIPKSVDECKMYLFFENKRRSGGGEIADLNFDEAGSRAVVKFCDPEVAKSLLEKKTVQYTDGTVMEICRPISSTSQPSDVKDDNSCEANVAGKVLVSEIPAGTKSQTLMMFLENKKRSGGGDIVESEFVYDEESGTASVTFKDSSVAEAMIQMGELSLGKNILKVQKPSARRSAVDVKDDKSSEVDVAGKVLVSEITAGTKSQTLMMFLENKKRSGGGDIVESEFDYDEEAGTASVTFKDSTVAEAMIQKGELLFGKSVLKVQKPSSRRSVISDVAKANEKKLDARPCESRTVELRGSVKDISKDNLLLFFENKSRSRGGEVQDIQILTDNLVVVTFKSSEDAAGVAAKGEHVLSKAKLSAALLDSWPDVGGPHAIRVKGFKKETSRDTMEMYFENKNRSGGEEFENFMLDENQQIAVITFSSPLVVQRIMKQKHVLEGSNLSVEPLKPGRPPPIVRNADADKLLFTDLDPLKIDERSLKEFVQQAGKVKVKKMTFSSHPGVVLVQFSEKPDYFHAKTIVCSRPYQGKMISLEQVSIMKCIQVHSIGEMSQDSLELYFESRKSGGGPLRTMEFVKGSYIIIEFNDQDVLERVLSKEHTFNQQSLTVQRYCPYLGIFPPGFDGSSPVPPIPPDFEVDCPREILKFFLTSHPKKRIEHHMNKRKCFLIWPRSDKTRIKLRCTVQPNDPNAFQVTQKWTEDCRKYLTTEMSKVKYGEISVLEQIWKSFQDKVTETTTPSENQVLFHDFDDQGHSLFYSGYAKDAQAFVNRAESIKSHLEEELDKLKKEIKEFVQLRPHVMYLSKMTNTLSQVTDDIKVEETDKGFNLTGQPQPVRNAKMRLFRFAADLFEKNVDIRSLSDAFEKVLSKASVKDYICQCFLNLKIIAVYEVRKGDVVIYSPNQDHLNIAKKVLLSEIVEKSIDLDEAMKDVLRKKDWAIYKDTFTNNFPFLELLETKSSLVFVAKESDRQEISRLIGDFLSGNAFYEQFVELTAGKLNVLTQYHNHLLENLKESVKPAELRVMSSGSQKSGFSIKAKKPALKHAEVKVRELVARLHSKDYPVDKQSAIKYLRSEKGYIMLQGIGAKHKVIIKPADEEESNEQKKIYSDPTVYATARLNQHPGKVIKLVLGDITKHKTDTVVNAANSKLDHISGVAGAIAKAGDAKLKEECAKHVKVLGEVPSGRVFVSVAGGSLPHKSVIHTVGPIWKDGRSGEEHELAASVTAALKEADRRLYKTVSLPLLSCGIYKFPKKKAAWIMVNEIKDFLATSLSVNEVHVVNGIQDSLNIFADAINNCPGVFSLVPSLMASISVQGSGQTKTRAKKSHPKPKPRPQRGPTSPGGMRSGGGDSFQTPEGLSVSLVRGSITNAKVDVIFNSVEKDLNLSRTAVSKSLLMFAGSGLQAECQASFPQGIGYGNVVKTGPHRIPCKAIYHGACARWDNGAGNSEQIIRKLVSGALQMAVGDSMTSLAFPAVGTGIKLRTPSHVVASVMIDEVIRFSAKVQKTCLKEVQFVIYEKDQDTLDAFGKALLAIGRSKASGDRNSDVDDDDEADVAFPDDKNDGDSNDDKSEEEDDDDEEEEPGDSDDDDDDDDDGGASSRQAQPDSDDDQGSGARRRRQYHGGQGKHGDSPRRGGHPSSSVTGLDSSIGNIKFLVNFEDITRASVDAIVNGTNGKFQLNYGKLSRAIFKAAGNRIQAECLQNRNPDGWSVSSGGRLSCSTIFHITAKDKKGLKELIEIVLKEADDRKLTSIAIPPIGVGRGCLTIKEFAEAVFEEVDNFSQTQPKHLQKINVSILDDKILEEFLSEIEKIMNMQGKPFKKLLSKVSNFFKSVAENLLYEGDDDYANMAQKRDRKPKAKRPKVPKTGRSNLSKLVLRINGMESKSVNDAVADIKRHCDEIPQETVLKSAEVKEAISKLTQDQENKLKILERQCSVKITINRQPGHESIVILSEEGNLTDAVAQIYSILIGFVTKEKNSRELELFAKQAIWQYQQGGALIKYGVYATGTIEKAHHKREKEVEYTDSKGVRHKINFKDMTDDRSSGGKVPVSRVVPGSIGLPRRWKPMKPEENCLVIKLDPTSEEYKKVDADLKKTAAGNVQNIIQIDRIQNQSLYRQFMNRKLDMERTNNLQAQAQAQEVERRLWHGTSGTNVNNINNRNFNRSYCGQHGVAIGNGVYFAAGAAYSASGYCPADPATGHKHIYQARVLTGKFCKGQSGLKEAPLLQGRSDVTYDSVVDNVSAPGMFVVFLDYQTYPEYHITFT